MSNPVRMHLLPLAVASILLLTVVPVELGVGTLRTDWPAAGDFIANVLLFLPLGAALSRQRMLTVVSIAFALTCTIELIQYWSIDRFTSPFDVLANTIGGFAGVVLWRVLRKSRKQVGEIVTLGSFAQAALAILCVAIVATWSWPGASSAVAGWDPSYALVLGNERTGNRSWEGIIEALALVPEAVSASAASRLSSNPPAQWREIIPRATLLDTQRHTLRRNTSLSLSQETARDFAARAAEANAFTVVARVEPASLEQSGPARILSFSWDPYHRNVDLGQERGRVVFRVRTPVSGENGGRVFARSEAVLRDRAMTLVASYDGAVSRVYLDGRLAARSNLAAAGCRLRATCDLGAQIAWTVIGASVLVLTIARLGPLSSFALSCVAFGTGTMLGAIVAALAGDARIVPTPWTAVLPLVGALTVVLAIQLAQKTLSVVR